MTAEEYRAARERLGLSQRELAERLGVHVQTVKARESGRPINGEAELAIRALAAGHELRGER